MSKPEPAIFTNMVMVYDGDRILVQKRNDPDWPGITFPGGHVEPKESFVRSAIREVKEETGLTISNLELCGIKQFTARDESYRYLVILYKTSTFSGELKSSDEGEVFWIKRSELFNYTVAESFDQMLEVFENDSVTENYNVLLPEGWTYENI